MQITSASHAFLIKYENKTRFWSASSSTIRTVRCRRTIRTVDVGNVRRLERGPSNKDMSCHPSSVALFDDFELGRELDALIFIDD